MSEQSALLACIPLAASEHQEKDSEFKAAFIGLTWLRNGFCLRFKASAALIEKTGRLISLPPDKIWLTWVVSELLSSIGLYKRHKQNRDCGTEY